MRSEYNMRSEGSGPPALAIQRVVAVIVALALLHARSGKWREALVLGVPTEAEAAVLVK